MEEKALRLSAVFLMILTAVSFVLLPKLPALHTWEVEAREERIAEEESGHDAELKDQRAE